MPKRTRIHGCHKVQLAIIAGYLGLAAGGALLLSLTSLNDDIQGVAPKDMALLGAVIGAGAAVVVDNLVRWRFDEERVDAPNKYLLGAACVGLAALGAFGFPYVHGPADAVPGQFKAAAGTFLTCLVYVVAEQVVRARYNKAHDRAEDTRTADVVAPYMEIAYRDGMRDGMTGAIAALGQFFNVRAQPGSAQDPSETSGLLVDVDPRRKASRGKRAGATAPLLLADAPPAPGPASAVTGASQRSSQRSSLLPQVAASGLGRAPTGTPPSSIAALIRA